MFAHRCQIIQVRSQKPPLKKILVCAASGSVSDLMVSYFPSLSAIVAGVLGVVCCVSEGCQEGVWGVLPILAKPIFSNPFQSSQSLPYLPILQILLILLIQPIMYILTNSNTMLSILAVLAVQTQGAILFVLSHLWACFH